MNLAKYFVIIEREGTAYGAYAPDIAGFGAAARSLRDVKRLAVDGLASHLAEMWRMGEPLPRTSRMVLRPPGTVEVIEVEVDLDCMMAAV